MCMNEAVGDVNVPQYSSQGCIYSKSCVIPPIVTLLLNILMKVSGNL